MYPVTSQDVLKSIEPLSESDDDNEENPEVNITNPFNINWNDPDYQSTITFPVHRRYTKIVVFRSSGGKCHKPVIYLYPKEAMHVKVTGRQLWEKNWLVVKSEMPFIAEYPKMKEVGPATREIESAAAITSPIAAQVL